MMHEEDETQVGSINHLFIVYLVIIIISMHKASEPICTICTIIFVNLNHYKSIFM